MIVTALLTIIIADEHQEGIVVRMLEVALMFGPHKRMDSDHAFLKRGSYTLARPLKLRIDIMRF